MESTSIRGISLNLWNPMSVANPICEICVIREICESFRERSDLQSAGITSGWPLRNPCNLRDFYFIISAGNLRICGICVRPFYGNNGWVDADAPRRVPTKGKSDAVTLYDAPRGRQG